MTTIACRDGIMAADSQETWDGSFKSKTVKLKRITKGKWKGGVFGFAGASHLANVIQDRLEDKRNRMPDSFDLEMEGSSEGMILMPDGIWTVNESCRPKKETLTIFAMGSGGAGAFSLMKAADFTAEAAVTAMCDIDTYTSGPVHTMSVEQKASLGKRIKDAFK